MLKDGEKNMGKGSKPNKKHDYGVNEEGFDAALSVEKYKEILLRSPLKVRTIIVMGSRAGGTGSLGAMLASW